MGDGHSHGAAVRLEPEAAAILARGIERLLHLTKGLEFGPLTSERYPLPVAAAVYGETPDPAAVRADVEERVETDPVAALERALVLLELFECNQAGLAESVPDDDAFLAAAFRSKRLNGWMALLGDADSDETAEAVNARWRFNLIEGPDRPGALYVLLNMLCRYGFVYGRIPPGDSHEMCHFIEDFTPGVVICRGTMTDLELTLSLAAMKLGVPAIVASDYPFPLGRRAVAETLAEVVERIVVFPNIRKLLDSPDLPKLPGYLDGENVEEEFETATVWGDTEESFFIFRKGEVDAAGHVEVAGDPSGPLGVVLTAEAEPLDAFDCQYIEGRAVRVLSQIKGVRAGLNEGRLIIELAAGVDLPPERIGEALIAAVRNGFPRIGKVSARVIFEREALAAEVEAVRTAQQERSKEIASATEESVDDFITCIGCSPFAPDHVCILTPERRPQCGRPYGMIKTGALYGYDDMSSIHHRTLHAGINSFGVAPKGELIDAEAGEWSGANVAVARLSGGRTTRVQLHSLDEGPHTGCGCFQLIMFKTEEPRPGVGIMDRKYKGAAPDGRTWRDLHYILGGKQAPGLAGASPNYLRSDKFLRAHGGWKGVVWCSPGIAAIMGGDLPEGVEVPPSG